MNTTRGKQRFTRESARAALVDAGRQILIERGIAPGLDRVTLKEAIERSNVPRTTAYRVFDGDAGSLADFHNAILAELDTSADADQTWSLVAEMLENAERELDLSDPVVLAELGREMVRVGFNHRVNAIVDQAEWRAYVSSIAGLEAREKTTAHASATTTSERFVPLFEMFGAVFGIRPIPPLTWSGFTSLLVAALDGAALRTLVDPSFDAIKRPCEPLTSDRTWNGISVIGEGLFLVWTEPDPNADTSADLSQWTAYRS